MVCTTYVMGKEKLSPKAGCRKFGDDRDASGCWQDIYSLPADLCLQQVAGVPGVLCRGAKS